MSDLYAALEIGTTRTVMAIGESADGGRPRITCHAEIPSTGVRKSQILDISEATRSIRSILQKIENRERELGLKVTIGNVMLAVSGQHLKADSFNGTIQVTGRKVSQEDIDAVIDAAHDAAVLSRDRELVDITDQDYVLDGMGGITSPLGMSGRVIQLHTLQIHGDHNRLQDARTAAEEAHLEVRETIFAASCAAEAVLEEYEKRNGVLVLDMGGGSTGYAVYSDGYLAAAGVLGVGGDHITSDIANAFQTTTAQAERLKTAEANAVVSANTGASARVKVELGESPLMDNRTISRLALDTVVNARVTEIFQMVREILEERDLLHRLHSGIVLTGGGAMMRGADAIAEQVLGSSARIGRPIHVDGLEDVENQCAYATIAGAILYERRNYEDKSFLNGILGRFFK